MKKFLNTTGSSMIQILMIGAAVLAVGGGVMKVTQNQSKENKSVLQRVEKNSFTNQLNNILSSPRVCTRTLSQMGVVSNNKVMPQGILGETGNSIMKIHSDSVSSSDINAEYSLYVSNGHSIKELKLTGYSGSGSGLEFSRVQLAVQYMP